MLGSTDHVTSILSQHDINDRESKVEYGEFIESVERSTVDNGSVKEPMNFIQPNAEDEVVAMLLSAMMGSIVDSWTKEAVDVWTKQTSGSQRKRSGQSSVLRDTTVTSHNSIMERTEDPNSVTSINSKRKKTLDELRTSSKIYATAPTTFDEDSVKNEDLRGSVATRTVTIQENPSAEKESHISRITRLYELLYNDRHKIYGWEFHDPDQEFNIKFKRGNHYEGKLLNCRMHGHGKFHWADGSWYEGEFLLGKMTGQGRLYWPDGSWYEGELCKGYRDGRGLYVYGPTFYAGYWKCGSRHGVGAMFYDHLDTEKHYYNGEWSNDKKHGTGLRSYQSGAMYSGQWRAGIRHGLGTMVWANCDVYSGSFHRGRLHGYGEYTWDTFFNKQLVVPEENCYYGSWASNFRHGNGTLETTAGVIVRGTWSKGKKHGPAEVVCSNGQFIYGEHLFDEDNLCFTDDSLEEDSLMNTSVQSLYRLPVSAARHEINLGYYVKRLIEFVNEYSELGKPFCVADMDDHVYDSKRTFSFNRTVGKEESKFDFQVEETYIRNVIMQFLSTLKNIYTTYSQACCEMKPTFPTVLMRIMWWQLLRDCDLHSRGFSLAYFDISIANNKASLVQGVHYPFERLLFWQFLHCLIEVSWVLYVKKCLGTPSVKGLLASAIHKLITEDLIPNVGRFKGNALFSCRDLLSFDALYWYYRGVGEPHSAREFLRQAVVPQENGNSQNNVPKYHDHQIPGKNLIGVGGRLTYFPKGEPLLKSKIHEEDPNHPKNLSFLSSLGLHPILECILQVCPSISASGLLVNMDYQIVFLEFYEILLLCSRKKAQKQILERNKEEGDEYRSVTPSLILPPDDHPPSEPGEDALPPPTPPKSGRKKSSGTKKPKKKKS